MRVPLGSIRGKGIRAGVADGRGRREVRKGCAVLAAGRGYVAERPEAAGDDRGAGGQCDLRRLLGRAAVRGTLPRACLAGRSGGRADYRDRDGRAGSDRLRYLAGVDRREADGGLRPEPRARTRAKSRQGNGPPGSVSLSIQLSNLPSSPAPTSCKGTGDPSLRRNRCTMRRNGCPACAGHDGNLKLTHYQRVAALDAGGGTVLYVLVLFTQETA